jgi:hypothetical protein
MPFHIEAARNAILHYIHETGKPICRWKKMIFLGSPLLEQKQIISRYRNCSAFYSKYSKNRDTWLGIT